ncbi:unnamed protein product [Gordionus sp. m RMFG-2023]
MDTEEYEGVNISTYFNRTESKTFNKTIIIETEDGDSNDSDTTVTLHEIVTPSYRETTLKHLIFTHRNAKTPERHIKKTIERTRFKYPHATNKFPYQDRKEKQVEPLSQYMPSTLFAEFESMRMPYVGAFFKFLAEQYEDIHDYPKDMCGSRFCNRWKVICKNKFYEVRKYENITAVESSSTGIEYTQSGLNKAFERIFRYLNGENDKNIIINMSTPIFILPLVATIRDPKQQIFQLLNNKEGPSISMDIPPQYGPNPPKPTNTMVRIVKYVTPVAYVRMFGGYALPTTFISKANELLKILELNKQKITHTPVHTIYNL